MIRLQFFARYREALDSAGEELAWQDDFARLEDIRAVLVARGGRWEVLGERGLMCARNQELCSLEEPVVDGDEVAFFPTVTGG